MKRCIQLARQGAISVAPNPMVGAVLVHEGRIIGEGFHEVYGSAHAEVNCISSVDHRDEHLITSSTLYVSLEPCSHFGKTPPCSDLIISRKIPRVVVGCSDPFHAVRGKGISKMKDAGIEVVQGILEKECIHLNRRFFTFHEQHRPYVVLKWAQTANKKIGNYGNARLMISNEYTQRLVHKWRSEEMGIMVGTNTAGMDNPQLTNRHWYGKNPVRVVIDPHLRLPSSLHLLDGLTRTIIFNLRKHGDEGMISYYQVGEDADFVHQVMNGLYQMNIMSVMVEGGAKWIQSLIDDNSWDEARVITNTKLTVAEGVPSPELSSGNLVEQTVIGNDEVGFYVRRETADVRRQT